MRHRSLKSSARDALVGYGEGVLDALAYFLRDPGEDIWVRRHIPATIARIPAQKSVDILIEALQDPDSFLRYKAVTALERLHRDHPALTFERQPIEALALKKDATTSTTSRSTTTCSIGKAAPGRVAARRRSSRRWPAPWTASTASWRLIYPWKDIGAARYAIEHGDARRRASASSTSTTFSTPPLRKRLMPLLVEMPIDEKVRRANVVLKTRPRDVEETLLQLINDDDQIVAAAAIDLVEEQKLWTLADDIEFVLAHRDAKDWYVFEAASWALAAHRMPAERRRGLWIEPLPVVQLAARLRALPVFASVASTSCSESPPRPNRFATTPARSSSPRVRSPRWCTSCSTDESSRRAGTPRPARSAPAALGFTEALSGMPMASTVRTDGLAVTLAMSRGELRTLLADNTDLVTGLFATLSSTPPGVSGTIQATAAAAELSQLAANGLTPVERVLALQRVPLFARVAADEMRQLADIAQAVTLQRGAALFPASAPPALWLVLTGSVVLTRSAPEIAPITVRGGEVIGSLEVMSGRSLGLAAEVIEEGAAVKIEREDLFSLLGERPELLRQIFSSMFRVDTARLSAF